MTESIFKHQIILVWGTSVPYFPIFVTIWIFCVSKYSQKLRNSWFSRKNYNLQQPAICHIDFELIIFPKSGSNLKNTDRYFPRNGKVKKKTRIIAKIEINGVSLGRELQPRLRRRFHDRLYFHILEISVEIGRKESDRDCISVRLGGMKDRFF